MSLLFILFAGYLPGMNHATEADPLAAVATLTAVRQTLAHTVRLGIYRLGSVDR